jgi:hypothetical protein
MNYKDPLNSLSKFLQILFISLHLFLTQHPTLHFYLSLTQAKINLIPFSHNKYSSKVKSIPIKLSTHLPMEHLETSNPIISIMLSSMDNYLPTTSPNIKEPNSNLIKMLLEINLSKKSLSIIWLKEMMALNPSITRVYL